MGAKKTLALLCIAILMNGCAVNKDFERAQQTNSIAAYENYISKHPNSKYTETAKARLAKLYESRDWENALNYNTISGYEEFMNSHPNSAYNSTAEKNILKLKEQRDWESIKYYGNLSDFKNFINRYPYGAHYYEARAKINELEIILPAWEKAETANTYQAYKDFANSYPNSSYASIAKDRMKEIERNDWLKAQNRNTISAYNDYLHKYPYGTFTDQAEKKIIDLEVAEIFRGDHGALPPATRVSSNSYYSTTSEIDITNDTKYTLTVRYSGPESTKIVLAPGRSTSITIKNGYYKVAASVNASNVQNYAGEENLNRGGYESMYYIETKTYNYWK